MIYAGIGSREIPLKVGEMMFDIGSQLAERGYTLRTGGVAGSDFAFEKGCDSQKGKKEVFVPWNNFGHKWGRTPSKNDIVCVFPEARKMIEDLVDEYKDFNKDCPNYIWKLCARNMQQILGEKLAIPVDFVLCYTHNGDELGGTRWAIRLARKHCISIYNLGNPIVFDRVKAEGIDWIVNEKSKIQV